MSNERYISLDIIRILACCMIVLMHSPIPSANSIDSLGPFLTGISYFTAPGIGLFFMVSGALLLPVDFDYFTFLRRRLSKIFLPTLLWTFIFLGLNIYYSISEINILELFLSIPFSEQGNGVLWFMYTMAGIYLLTPILSAWIKIATIREIEFILLLWSITLCYPLLDNILIIHQETTGILYYFTGYAGYFLLGYYMKNYPNRLPLSIPLTLTLLGLVSILYLKFNNIGFDFYNIFWYLSIFIASFCCTIWIFIIRVMRIIWKLKKNIIPSNFIIIISNLSFGIYLTHILIMRYWLWDVKWIKNISNYILQTFLIAALTLAISAFVCYILAHIPFIYNLVGYRFRSRK